MQTYINWLEQNNDLQPIIHISFNVSVRSISYNFLRFYFLPTCARGPHQFYYISINFKAICTLEAFQILIDISTLSIKTCLFDECDPLFFVHLFFLLFSIAKSAPNSTQHHPLPPSSKQLYPAHFSLHPSLCNTLVIRTKILHAIEQFPQVQDKKIQSQPFCLKTGTRCNLDMLILNLDLDFQNSDPKVHSWENLDRISIPYLSLFEILFLFGHTVSFGFIF